jgi:hypothetical protein
MYHQNIGDDIANFAIEFLYNPHIFVSRYRMAKAKATRKNRRRSRHRRATRRARIAWVDPNLSYLATGA